MQIISAPPCKSIASELNETSAYLAPVKIASLKRLESLRAGKKTGGPVSVLSRHEKAAQDSKLGMRRVCGHFACSLVVNNSRGTVRRSLIIRAVAASETIVAQ